MNMRRHLTPLVTFSLIALVALVASCGDKATNPPGGGGATLELNSATLGNGQQYPHVFASVGTFNYHCKIHGSMTGSVVVGGAGAPMTASVSITGSAFVPSSVAVAQGGTVTWTNNDGATPHTVTSD